jgi:hypothetical protein
VLALLAGSSASACRATETLSMPPALEVVAAEPLPVTMSAPLRRWREKTSTFGHKTEFRFGELLMRLFPASDGRAFLSPVRATLDSDWDASAGEWTATYTFELSLQREGVHHPIDAAGRGSSAESPSAAERAAQEACVAEIYTQLSKLLASPGR